jgi:dinuclear metal center YbgI/SA1388 family protein
MESYTVEDMIRIVDGFAPPHLAMGEDAIGLQIGHLDKNVRKVWVALDPSPAVIQAAVDNGIDMLVTHHALIYHPLKTIRTETAKGASIREALVHDLAIYTAHTNLDIADGGVNDVLANMLSLQNVEILDETYREMLCKIVVFVPVGHAAALREAICEAGAGNIGKYSHCTYAVEGAGTFRPHAGTNPFVGKIGFDTKVAEVRLETIVEKSNLDAVVRVMLDAHPYEEVAYDIYPLLLPGKRYGIGRIGDLQSPVHLQEFAESVKIKLGLHGIRFGGNPNLLVSRVAVLGGAGGNWAKHAMEQGAQAFVTSDSDHHEVAEAWQDGLAIVDATHAAMERPVLEVLCSYIRQHVPSDIQVEVSNLPEDPYHFL